MRRSIWKKAAWIGIAMLLGSGLNGCGAGQQTGAAGQPEAAAPSQQPERAASMGRYVEQELVLPEDMASNVYSRRSIGKLAVGSLEVLDEMAGMYRSADFGEKWEKEASPWLDELHRKAYITELALASDGGAALICDREENEEDDEELTCLYIDADGTCTEFAGTGERMTRFFFDSENRLYGYGVHGGVYRADTESRRLEKLFDTEGFAEYACFTEDYMVVFATGGVVLYDMEQGMVAEEDRVLSDFVMENLGGRMGVNTDGYSLAAAAGEGNVIYLAFSKGLYRHVLGGTAVEQVMDGSLCSLGDQTLLLRGMEVFPNQEFVILYSNAVLCRYVYDEEMPTVPEEQICIYSLAEDYTIRQAVGMFQKRHPEAYVRYEVGMTGEDGVTKEDALRNLNTKLMGGEGPDLLVLDELPAESYREKGMLADLSGMAEELTADGALFPNLAEAFRKDGKICSLPVRFRLPLLLGDQKTLEGADDLEALAEAVEALRAEYPKGKILGLVSEEEVLYTLGIGCEAAWADEKGAIDETALADFLTCASRIYQAELAGLTAEELAGNMDNWGPDIIGEGRYYANASANAMSIARKKQHLGLGTVNGMDFDFSIISTIDRQEPDFDWKPFAGQVEQGFIPKTEVGIYAGSGESPLALEFFRFLFGEELQSLDLPAGFPVSRKVFDGLKENPREGQAGMMIGEADGGETYALDIQWPGDEEYERLLGLVESAKEVCTGDARIREAVEEFGAAALNGSMSIEEAVKEIVKKAEIYLAE